MKRRGYIRFISLLMMGLFSGALIYGLDLRKQGHLWMDMQHQAKNLNIMHIAQREKISHCERYRQEFSKTTLKIENVLKQLPEQHDPTQSVETLTQVSESAGLMIRSLRWLSAEHPVVADVFPIEICLEGNYHAFGVFLSHMMALPRAVTLHDFSIQSSNASQGGDPLWMNITLKVYSYRAKNKEQAHRTQMIEVPENSAQQIEDYELSDDLSSNNIFNYGASDLRSPFALNKSGFSTRMDDTLLIGTNDEMVMREKFALEAIQQDLASMPLTWIPLQMQYAKAEDIAALLQSKSNMLLSARGAVSFDARTNTLLVQDTSEHLSDVARLVQALDVPVRQVMIESRIIFASDDFERELGLQLHPGGFESMGLSAFRLPIGNILDLELLALAHEGLGKIVASPRLITADQQKAYIESGEEIPYQESAASGAASTAFKKAVLRLEVTPQITPDDHIILDLKVNQDSRGQVTAGIPAIHTRELQTKVLVAHGETVVLGGIYQHQKNRQQTYLPFLGKLPCIGSLFQSQRSHTQTNELLIFVTPHIIQSQSTAN